MKPYLYLLIPKDPHHDSRTVTIGEATDPKEKEEIFALRYKVYGDRGYIDTSKYPTGLERDSFDDDPRTSYIAAWIDGKIIGSIRIIRCDPLPTESYFDFKEPKELANIPREQRVELGRFVIVPPDKETQDYLPRGLIMLSMIHVLAKFGTEKGYDGGYAFIKQSLARKMERFDMPFRHISPYVQHYPSDGTLQKYFSQPDDPVAPMHFITSEFLAYTEHMLHRRSIFKSIDDVTVALRSSLYTKFLRAIRAI